MSIINSSDDLAWEQQIKKTFRVVVDGMGELRHDNFCGQEVLLMVEGLDPNPIIEELVIEASKVLNGG